MDELIIPAIETNRDNDGEPISLTLHETPVPIPDPHDIGKYVIKRLQYLENENKKYKERFTKLREKTECDNSDSLDHFCVLRYRKPLLSGVKKCSHCSKNNAKFTTYKLESKKATYGTEWEETYTGSNEDLCGTSYCNLCFFTVFKQLPCKYVHYKSASKIHKFKKFNSVFSKRKIQFKKEMFLGPSVKSARNKIHLSPHV
jgi:hypothetical protein